MKAKLYGLVLAGVYMVYSIVDPLLLRRQCPIDERLIFVSPCTYHLYSLYPVVWFRGINFGSGSDLYFFLPTSLVILLNIIIYFVIGYVIGLLVSRLSVGNS